MLSKKPHINRKPTNDLVGYEALIEYLKKSSTNQLTGDFLEIGAFMGGGSAKLARYGSSFGKTLFVVDIFKPNFDNTKNNKNVAMNFIYNSCLGRSDQRSVFDQNTKDEENIVVYAKNSKNLKLDDKTKLCFSFIDGNHDPEYVKNDFNIAWPHTVPNGIVSFHDYSWDLPLVTKAIDELLSENSSQISRTEQIVEKHILFIHKKSQNK